jgi:hypothetical protein
VGVPGNDSSRSAEELAQRAADEVLGCATRPVQLIAAGRSCQAFFTSPVVLRPGRGDWVVRVPVPGTDRSIRFRAEAALGNRLRSRGHPVASWMVVEVDGVECVVGERLPGLPVTEDTAWDPALCAGLGDALAELHDLGRPVGPSTDRTWLTIRWRS